jgi:hypothetical protein
MELKGTQAWNLLNNFFAETESLWSQEPVTRDFLKSYFQLGRDIWLLNISANAQPAMKSFPRPYAQQAEKSFPRWLSVRLDVHVKTVKIWTGWLSMRGNSFGVDSECNEIVYAYAQQVIKIVFVYAQPVHAIISEKYKKVQIKMHFSTSNNRKSKNRPGFHLPGPNWTSKKITDTSQQLVSRMLTQSPKFRETLMHLLEF